MNKVTTKLYHKIPLVSPYLSLILNLNELTLQSKRHHTWVKEETRLLFFNKRLIRYKNPNKLKEKEWKNKPCHQGIAMFLLNKINIILNKNMYYRINYCIIKFLT